MQGFDDWAARYRRLFSLNRPEDSQLFAEWELVFDKAGFTADDLEAAIDILSLNPPQTRGGHHKALVDGCRRVQADRRGKASAPMQGQRCALCLQSGRVIVPHIATINGTVRGWHTMAVACMCEYGRRLPGLNL